MFPQEQEGMNLSSLQVQVAGHVFSANLLFLEPTSEGQNNWFLTHFISIVFFLLFGS